MNSSQKLTRSALVAMLPIATQVLYGFIIIPELIEHLGDEIFGLWILIIVVVGYSILLDFGFRRALVRELSASIDDRIEGNRWITMAMTLLAASTFAGILVLILGIYACELFISTNLSLIRTSLLICGGAAMVSLAANQCGIGILQAHVRGDVQSGIVASTGVLRVTALLVAVHMEAHFLVFISIVAGAMVLQGFALIIAALKVHKGFTLRKDGLTQKRFKAFASYARYSFFVEVADLLRLKAFPLIISSFLGLAAITVFTIANQIINMLTQVFNQALIALIPVYSRIDSTEKDPDKLNWTFLFSYKLSSTLIPFICGMTAILGEAFIFRWMGPDRVASVELLMILLIGTCVAGLNIPTICMMYGTSRLKFYAKTNTIEAVLVLSLAIGLIPFFGLAGLAWGATIAMVIMKGCVEPAWISGQLAIPPKALFVNIILVNLIKTAVFLTPVYLAAQQWLQPNYLIIGIIGACACLCYAPYNLLTSYTKQERGLLINSFAVKLRS